MIVLYYRRSIFSTYAHVQLRRNSSFLSLMLNRKIFALIGSISTDWSGEKAVRARLSMSTLLLTFSWNIFDFPQLSHFHYSFLLCWKRAEWFYPHRRFLLSLYIGDMHNSYKNEEELGPIGTSFSQHGFHLSISTFIIKSYLRNLFFCFLQTFWSDWLVLSNIKSNHWVCPCNFWCFQDESFY